MKKDLHQEITDKIVKAMEAGLPPWLKPWKDAAGFGFEPYNAFTGRPYNGINYAMEELVAELGSAFLCAQMGIELKGLQHENYIAGWIKALKDDKKAIFTAASKAKQAAKFLMDGAVVAEEAA